MMLFMRLPGRNPKFASETERSLEDSCSTSQLEGRTLASAIDNHQEWQSQVESKLSDLTADQQSKDLKTVELR